MASCYLPTILPAHDTARVIPLAGALGALAATAAAQSAAPQPKPAVSYGIPTSLGDGWTTGAAERVGLDRCRHAPSPLKTGDRLSRNLYTNFGRPVLIEKSGSAANILKVRGLGGTSASRGRE